VTLTLDWVMWHTVVHHSLTSNYIPNFIGIGKTFLWMDGRMDGVTDIWTSETHIIRSTLRSRHSHPLMYLFSYPISPIWRVRASAVLRKMSSLIKVNSTQSLSSSSRMSSAVCIVSAAVCSPDSDR